MKILLIADIHSNWPALAAIEESFDVCLFLGDLVEYGTDPVPCIDWVRRHAVAYAIRGNHDHAVAQRVPARNGSGYRRLTAATRPLHWKALDSFRLKYLGRLPVTRAFEIDGQRFFMVHGTPRDPLDEYLTTDKDAWRQRLTDIRADFVCVGHSHIQYQLDLGDTQVINPGSVGQPRDGQPGAAYAVIENGQVELRRVQYDHSLVLDQMARVGMEPWVIEITEQILRTGGQVSREDLDRIAGPLPVEQDEYLTQSPPGVA